MVLLHNGLPFLTNRIKKIKQKICNLNGKGKENLLLIKEI